MTDIAALLRGDAAAWNAFAAEVLPKVHRAVELALGRYAGRAGTDVVEDLAQETLVKLVKDDYRVLRQFDPERASLATWLALVARGTAIDYLRRRKLKTGQLDPEVELAAPTEPEPAEPLVIPPGLLSPRQRLVLQLSFDLELSVEAISAQLGIDPQSVRSTRHKAIEKLRAHFAAVPRT